MTLPITDYEYTIVELHPLLSRDGTKPWLEWCYEIFGPPSPDRWFWRPNKIYFHNSYDHMMFLIRWG
jgi:hypothetical protein